MFSPKNNKSSYIIKYSDEINNTKKKNIKKKSLEDNDEVYNKKKVCNCCIIN